MTQTPDARRTDSGFGSRAEERLLLACARPKLAEAGHARIAQILAAPLDWPEVIRAAHVHGLIPLLHHHLAERHVRHIPESVLTSLATSTLSIAATNLQLEAEMVKVCELATAAQVPVMPVKGPIAALDLYGNLGLRPFVDIDFLVPADHVFRFITVLQHAGYTSELRVPEANFDSFLSSACEYPFDSPSKQLVELQWDVVPRYFALDIGIRGFWERSQPAVFKGQAIRSLETADLMLLLLIHGAKHMWARLIWLTDVAELSPRLSTSEWQEVIDRGRRAGALRMALVGLSLAMTMLDTALPPLVTDQIQRDSALPDIRCAVLSRMSELALIPSKAGDFRFLLTLRENPGDRFKSVWRLASTPGPAEWAMVRLPRRFDFLYTFVRLVRASRHLLGVPRSVSQAITRRLTSRKN